MEGSKVGAGKEAELSGDIEINEEQIRSHLHEVVRGTVEETLNAMLEADAERLCGAGRFETAIIERYRRRESSVEKALIEMYIADVSVRRVEDITEAAVGDAGGAFPGGQSAVMLVAARLRHIAGTQWGTRCYLDPKRFAEAAAEEPDDLTFSPLKPSQPPQARKPRPKSNVRKTLGTIWLSP